ncbi:MAG: PIN domain-containing protein [Acidobacteriota bacterium]
MRLFLDANVIFTAAHNAAGRSAAILDLTRLGRCRVATSRHAADEARRNLELKYPDALSRFDTLARQWDVVPEAAAADVAWATEQGLPQKDAPILASAVACGADMLVTGDRTHFGHLLGRRIRGMFVLTPAEALARILPE